MAPRTWRGRVPWFRPDELDANQRRLYESITASRSARRTRHTPLTDAFGRLEGPFNAMLLNPGLGLILQELGASIRYHGSLPDRTRELAILEIARLRACKYEWYAHEAAGRAAGLTDAELGALRDGAEIATLDRQESLVREAVRSLIVTRDLSDSLFKKLDRELSSELLYELIILVGYYDLQALTLEALRVPLPDIEGQVRTGCAPPGT